MNDSITDDSAMDDSAIQIGIETELLLSHRPGEVPPGGLPDVFDFAANLSKSYNNSAIGHAHPKMHFDLDGKYNGPANTQWSITTDVRIDHGVLDYPIEIVSPIFQYQPNSPWRDSVQHLWVKIEESCLIETDKSCGTHVHMSPSGNKAWDIGSLKSICRAIIYFERVFEILVPEHRRGNFWAKNFRADHPRFRDKSGPEIFALIEQQDSPEAIVHLMNPQRNRYYTWNFQNLLFGGKSTIEFRQPPGVKGSDDCLAWVELAASFARSARALDTLEQLYDYRRDVQGLKRFLNANLVFGMSEPKLMTPIFVNKSGFLEPNRTPELSGQDSEKLEKKKKEDSKKNIMMADGNF